MIREVINDEGDPYILSFQILDRRKLPQYIVSRASTVQRYAFIWEESRAFSIDSSDIGLIRYERGADGIWVAGEVMERISPDQNVSARILVAEHGNRLSMRLALRNPGGGNRDGTVIPFDKTSDDVPPEYFIDRTRGPLLTSRCLEWTDDRSVVLHCKQGDVRGKIQIVNDVILWNVEKSAP